MTRIPATPIPPVTPEGRLGDGGLQIERTELAWRRTECSLAVAALVGLRIAVHIGNVIVVLSAGFLLVCTIALVVVHRFRSPNGPRKAHVTAVFASLLGVLATAVVVGLVLGLP